MGQIFISYSHKDKLYVHKLTEALQRDGFDVWIDDRIDYGAHWPKVIQSQLDACDAFIVVVSENSFDSEWVQNEVARAKRKAKPFFPLLLSGDPWLSVEVTQWVDVRDGSLPTEKFYERLSSLMPQQKTPQPVIKDVAIPQTKPTMDSEKKSLLKPAGSRANISKPEIPVQAQKLPQVRQILLLLNGPASLHPFL